MKKILIANRGEIALRIVRACKDLNIESVAIYSEEDRYSLHVLYADEAICVGPSCMQDSYLHYMNILSICDMTHVDGIHPGYGFLSEDPRFAHLCEQHSIIFIGPSSQTLSLIRDKVRAKVVACNVGIATVPGSSIVHCIEDGLQEAVQLGFPVFVKPIFGGGGMGIRMAKNEEEFPLKFFQAQNESYRIFGHKTLYVEKMMQSCRHVEIQVIGDRYGHYVHLGERDCTVQRRRKKLVEETPSLAVDTSLRWKMGAAAIRLLQAVHYHAIGTVEFLLDELGSFYFMEVNPRIQVEHAITEEVTGIDLVKEQIQLSCGEKLQHEQSHIILQGSAIEFRIQAEYVKHQLRSCRSRIGYFLPSSGPWVRVESACYSGCYLSSYYDPLIAKLIVKGKNREEMLRRSRRALEEFYLDGIETNLSLHKQLCTWMPFCSGCYSSTLVEDFLTLNDTRGQKKHDYAQQRL